MPRPQGPSQAGTSYARPVPVKPPPAPPQPTQPATVKLSSSGLRNFAFRLTHPPEIPAELVHSPVPPAQSTSAREKGKARASWWSWDSWGIRIQPHYEVSLEDVLARKHLPPLGLKDFEEWLLFVDGTPENLYFILWLREYTARYERWTSSLKSAASKKHAKRKRRRSNDIAFNAHPPPTTPLQPPPLHYPNPLQPPAGHHFPSSRPRPFPSLGVAISSLSIPAPQLPTHAHSQPSSPTVVPSPTSPATLNDTAPGPELLDPHDTDRRYRPYAPSPPPLPPNPSLALFYLRAKETFFVPNAPYELNVGSAVLGAFFTSEEEKVDVKRDSGNPYDALRNLSSRDFQKMMQGTKGLGGKLPPPPDPQVFAELRDIIEARLRASLARLVVATYNNVGMSRAYCGNAGGLVIGATLSGPPLAACFSLHAARWWRLLALPGMWLGLTIFICALYGVCMMIYIFGDLRQLRSFELARPAISKPKPLKGDPLRIHRDSLKNGTSEKGPDSRNVSKPPSPTGVTFTNPFPTPDAPAIFRTSPSQSSVSPASQTSLPGLDSVPESKAVPRKMSLPTGLFFGSRARAEQEESERERFMRMLREATTPLTHPPVMPSLARVRSASVNDAASGDEHPITAPARVYFAQGQRRSLDGAALQVARTRSGEDYSDGEYATSSSYDYSDSESDSDGSDEESVDPHQLPRRRRRRRRPVIEVSDAFYDENPAPEGPATAPADWFPSSLERAARMNPIRDCPGPVPPQSSHFTSSNASSHLTSSRGSAATNGRRRTAPAPDPLWPDYDASNDNTSVWAKWKQRDAEDTRRAERTEPERETLPGTAMFIQPFTYDAAGDADDLEKGLRQRTAGAAGGSPAFDFDGLPPRTTFSLTLKSSPARGKGKDSARASSPTPSHGAGSDLGSAINIERSGWLARRWWRLLETMQRRCGPENVVQVLRRQRGGARRGPHAAGEKRAEGRDVEKAAEETARSRAREHAESAPAPATREAHGWRARVRRVYLSVPAFAAPLTPVLNPLVGRAQWEIVVRSAALAAVISVCIVGALLGVPE